MADRTEALVLRMEADISRMEKSLRKIAGETDRNLKRVEDRFYKTNQHIKRSGDRMAQDLRISAAAIAGAFAFRELAQAADKWTNLRNQVGQYTSVLGPTEEATARLLTVANDAGVAIDSLGTTFAASARAAKTLGASADQVFAFNEAVAKGSQIANTGAAAVNGALVQLGQAIGSPKVQLGEFNSVIEGTPRLAQAFADGITEAGGSVAKLRELIASGEISGAQLFKGLLSQLPTLRREFNASEATISRSLNRLNNQFLQYVGNADKATNGTRLLNGFIETIANNFNLLADATVVAALAIGGTLAAQAVVKAISGVYQLQRGLRDAKTAMDGFRAAAAIFGGPLGVLIAGVGGALVGLALSAGRAEDAFDRLQGSIDDYKRIQGDIARDTETMKSLHQAVANAIRTQGDAAEATARREEVAIARRIEANKKLAGTMRSTIQTQLVEAERALTERARPGNRLDQFLQLLGAPLEGVLPKPDVDSLSVYQAKIAAQSFLKDRGPNGTSEADFRKVIDDRLAIGLPPPLPDDDYILQLLTKIDLAEAKVADLRAQITALDKAAGPGLSGGFTDAATAATGATAAADGYRTALEQLQGALGPLRDLRKGELDSLQKLEGAYETNRATAEAAAEDMTFLAQQEAALNTEREKAGEAFVNRSRIAVQAILGYASASGDLADALKQTNDAADLLTSDDRQLVFKELTRLIGDATAAIATGYDKLVRERDSKLAEIDRAMIAGLGIDKATFDALSDSAKRQMYAAASVYIDAIDAAHQAFKDGIAGLAPGAAGLNLDTPDLDRDPAGPTPSSVLQGILPSEAQYAFQEAMAESIKYALRDGIMTGDWDDAFRNVLADAVVSGMDSALNRLSDWISEFLFAPDGIVGNLLSGVVSGAGGWMASMASMVFGGARAAGGPVTAGKTYLVGERGPELFTAGNSGQILNAADTNRLMASKGQGGSSVVVNLNVAGSIDAVTWPRVEAALQGTSQRIMSAVPAAVRGTISHDRRQKRRL